MSKSNGNLLRKIDIIRFHKGRIDETVTWDFYVSHARTDRFRVLRNGKTWNESVGLTKVLDAIRRER